LACSTQSITCSSTGSLRTTFYSALTDVSITNKLAGLRWVY
jgi:hypothetical protein